jgi:hypothetical protein
LFRQEARAALTQSSRSHLIAHTDHEQSLTVGGGTGKRGLGNDRAARDDSNPG